MSRNVIGLVLIDAPYSALNNAGTEVSQTTENIVIVKTMKKGRGIYPYVSGQAWRNWWRATVKQEFNWNLSPIEYQQSIAFTAANPIEYDDDDVFGYMKAPKGGKEILTRLSPLKCSPLVSVSAQTPTEDFGVMARHEGNPVLYNHQFYSCVLKGIFSLDLDAVGTFWDVNKTGYKNIKKEYVPVIEREGGTRSGDKAPWILPREIRIRRCKETIKALELLSGGAKLTTHLTDVTPKLIVVSVLNGGNHPFMNLMVEKNSEGLLSLEALKQVINDYSDRFLDKIYIGRRQGFMDELDADIRQLSNDRSVADKIFYASPNEAITELLKNLEKHIQASP